MQSLPLEAKIRMSKMRIQQWYYAFNSDVYVSFSGGKDSTVLLHMARQMFPDIPAVFCDTGLEYPEIRDFVKSCDGVEIIYPVVWDKKKRKYIRTNFRQVIEKYGYPVASKEISKRIYELRHHNLTEAYRSKLLYGIGGTAFNAVPKQWHKLIDAPFEVSSKCCDAMKKRPFHKYEKDTGRVGIVATMAEESALRLSSWMQYGCNAFDKSTPQSRPMSFWTEQDVLEYISIFKIPYCSAYGDIVFDPEAYEYHTTGCDRTGCMFCMYGCHREKSPNRFQRMKLTHPKQYEYCMKPWGQNGLGLDAVLTYIGVEH